MKFTLITLLTCFLAGYSFSADSSSYIITKENDTLYFDKIEIEYFKRAVCQNGDEKKQRFSAKKLIKVNINGEIYESGKIAPLALGWKKYLLLYRHPDVVTNQEIVVYSYNGPSGGSMTNDNGTSNGFNVTTYAVRNRSNIRGDFGKMSINSRKRILEACPNCSQECIDIIMNTPIEQNSDIYTKIILKVNQNCSQK